MDSNDAGPTYTHKVTWPGDNSTNDPLYAAVLAAVAQGGWEAGIRAIELIVAGTPVTCDTAHNQDMG